MLQVAAGATPGGAPETGGMLGLVAKIRMEQVAALTETQATPNTRVELLPRAADGWYRAHPVFLIVPCPPPLEVLSAKAAKPMLVVVAVTTVARAVRRVVVDRPMQL